MMAMDLMIPLSSLSLHENTTLSSSACHPTPLTNSNPLMLVYLVLFHAAGQNGAMRLLRILQKKCHEKISLRSIWTYGT